MRALTVRQPHAWAVTHAGQPLLNLSWRTRRIGRVAIHAASALPYLFNLEEEIDCVAKLSGNATAAVWEGARTRGAICAVARLEAVCDDARFSVLPDRVPCRCGPWALPGRYHWRLTEVRALAEPVPATGRQGLWKVPGRVEHLVRAGLREVAAHG